MAPAVVARPGRPLTPAPAGAARAGSPPVELASSSGLQALPTPVRRSDTSGGMEAFVSTQEYLRSPGGRQALPPAVELAVSSSTMEPLAPSFDNVPLDRD